MLEPISPVLYRYRELHGAERGEPYDWNSYVFHLPDANVLALIDPLEPLDRTIADIEALGTPTHILLTCEWHLRNGSALRDLWGAEILVNQAEAGRYKITLNRTFDTGDRLWGCVDTVYLDRGFYPETSLLVRSARNVLIIGDILSGGRLDQQIPKEQIGNIAPQYIPDLVVCRNDLRQLLDLEFDRIYFGHGDPVTTNAKNKLRAYLDSDDVWAAHEATKRERGDMSAE